MNAATAPRRAAAAASGGAAWRERSARLYEELQRPARAMIRRAFRGAFADDEIEDIYSSAWVGTLRALERRHEDLDDEDVRKYVLTAVANHASKELRRRSRRPTAPLDAVDAIADVSAPPDERVASREQSRITRDLLGTLPPRRRAVMLLRYGWGLEPRQVCALVNGLSARAYRKEITRGIDELAEKLRLLERGEWCADREPVLKAYAAGLADPEQQRQAQQHLTHCRHCADFVGRLSGHLHDLGGAVVVPGAIDGIDDRHLSLVDRAGGLVHKIRETAGAAFGDRGADLQEAATQSAGVSASVRGAGAAGSGVLAKLAGLGTAGKIAAACLGSSAAATACIATGVVPADLSGVHLPGAGKPDAVGQHPVERSINRVEPQPPTPPQQSNASESPPAGGEPAGSGGDAQVDVPPPEPAPPEEQEFGLAPATTSGDGSSGSSPSGGGGSAVDREFGP
jgi:RNA polymerase sigma factor (sigma-70 family)